MSMPGVRDRACVPPERLDAASDSRESVLKSGTPSGVFSTAVAGLFHGLSIKLALPACFLLLVAIASLYIFFSERLSRQALVDLRVRLETYAEHQSANLSFPIWNLQTDIVEQMLRASKSVPDLARMAVLDLDGAIIYAVDGDHAPAGAGLITDRRDIVHPKAGERFHLGYLETSFHDGRLREILREQRQRELTGLAALIPLMGFFIWLSMHVLVGRPLLRLRQSLIANARHGRRDRLAWSGKDEMGQVAEAYNDLLSETERKTEELQAANVSLKAEITRRFAMEEELRSAAQVYEVALEGIAIIGSDGRVLSVNPSFSRITGYSGEDIVGRPAALLRPRKPGNSKYAEMMEAVQTGDSWRGEVLCSKKSGEAIPIWLSLSVVRSHGGAVRQIVAVFQDVSEEKRRQALIEHQAYHDPLTGLCNRTRLNEEFRIILDRAKIRGEHPAVLYIDLDNFKTVNDTQGHETGDALLVQVSNRMRHVLRDGDILARVGGDEFLIVLTDMRERADILRLSARISNELRTPILIGGEEFRMTASMGAALYPGDGQTSRDLVKNAGIAMYKAKQQGGDGLSFFNQDML